MIIVPKGIPAPLRMQLDDGVTNRFVRAVLYDSTNSPIGSVDLLHITMGMYVGYHSFADPGFVNIVYSIYMDNQYSIIDPYYRASSETYRVTDDSQGNTDLVDAIWSKNLTPFNVPNSAGAILKSILVESDPESIAGFVWNALASDFHLPGSFGLYIDVVRQSTLGVVNDLASSSYGLAALKAQTINTGSMIKSEIDANENKIDAIIPVINSARSAIINQVDENQILIESVSTQLTSARADIISEVNQNEVKIDSVQSSVNSLSNNTTTRFIVPEVMIKPDVGTKNYQFHLRLFDSNNNPEAPDSFPTIRVRDLTAGVDTVNNVAMLQDGSKVGAFYFIYTISAGSDVHPLLVEATVVEEGKTRYIPAVTEVTEYGADLQQIQSQLTVVNTKVTDTQTKINSGVFGLQAIRTSITDTVNEVLTNRALIQTIKVKTDALPASVASQADVAGVNTAINALPRMQDITAALELIRTAIMGSTNKSNTDVYNHFDLSSVAKTNDPRFNNLDASISSRSTLTVAEVWGYANRTLTSMSISASDMRKIWEVLVSEISVPGSFGRLFQDYLDSKISSRATASQVQTLLSGVAQQSSLLQITSQIVAEIDQNEIKLNSLLTLLNTIKPQTDKIVEGGSKEASVLASQQALTTLINNLQLIVNVIRAKTDIIPTNPAKEESVLARPVNPLLTNDARLSNLDAKVSTRSTLALSQLSDIVTESDLGGTESRLNGKFVEVAQALNSLFQMVADVPTNAEFAYKVDPLATSQQLATITNQILTAIANNSGSGSGGSLTAADVWSYANRALTAAVQINSTQYNALAKTGDGDVFEHKISTVYRNEEQEIMVWSERNGQRKIGTECTVFVKTADGDSVWNATASSANSAGVFKFISPIALTPNTNYMVIISAIVDGAVRTTQQSFFTVGN